MRVLRAIGFWLVSLTWGALLTIPGLFVALFCIVFLHGKPHRNGLTFIVEIGGDWGGFDMGAVALCGGYTTTCPSENWFEHTRRHEYGHALQNLIFGPFMLFIVTIPSVIRYHYQNYRAGKGLENKPYDAIWFEGTATAWGSNAIDIIEGM